jgi:hypothetical protein
MAKKTKREPKPRQQRIPGTIDVPTEAVLKKAEEYVETLQSRMTLQTDEGALRQELIELMKAGGVVTFALDGHTVTLKHLESDKIEVKKDKADAAED